MASAAARARGADDRPTTTEETTVEIVERLTAARRMPDRG